MSTFLGDFSMKETVRILIAFGLFMLTGAILAWFEVLKFTVSGHQIFVWL